MNFNQRIDLIQTQKLVMTTQLKQSLSLLNMSKLELEEEIKREVEENPTIEIEKTGEINWEEYIKYIDKTSYKKESYSEDNEFNIENIIKETNNLYDHLKFQINLYKLSDKEREVCDYIIDSLDKDGYLRTEESHICEYLHIDKEEFINCLNKVQQLEPIGIGARTLSECLLIQLRSISVYDEIIECVIEEDLDLIANNKIKDIAKKYNISIQKAVSIVNIIKQLEPKPGRFCSSDQSSYIVPDVIVEKIDDKYIVYTNEKDTYKIRINNFYKEILTSSQADKEAKTFIKDKLNSASNLIKNIENRKSTILKISEEILESQKEFFKKGVLYLKPLRMKDIAIKLDYHESTISRGVNGKYMLTPFGMFELKYFFSNSIEDDVEATSTTSIKKVIEEIIKSENKSKPYSDDKIVSILKEKNISIARRTVAKYREELGILSSSKRKQY